MIPKISRCIPTKFKMKFSLNVNRDAILCLNAYLCSRDVSRGQNFKIKEIGELVAIYFGWFKKWTFLIEENLLTQALNYLSAFLFVLTPSISRRRGPLGCDLSLNRDPCPHENYQNSSSRNHH